MERVSAVDIAAEEEPTGIKLPLLGDGGSFSRDTSLVGRELLSED